MNKIKTTCALLLILALSACSSSGGGGSSGGGSPVVPIDLSEALGVEGGPIGGVDATPEEAASTLLRIEAAFDEVEKAIDDGSLTVPTPVPTGGSALLNGYIRVAGRNPGEIIVGNLEIIANFGTSKADARAKRFSEFRISDDAPPELLTGPDYFDPDDGNNELNGDGMEGTIDGTSITSPLIGFLYDDDRNYQMIVNANLEGDIYEDGDRLIAYGTVSSDATTDSVSDGTIRAFSTGEFAASEARPPSE